MLRAGLLFMAALLLSACAQIPPPQARPAAIDEPPVVATSTSRKGVSGGVFLTDAAWSITSDSRAFRSGDIVTVVLQETTQASKKADTSFGKGSSASIKPTLIGGKTLKTDLGVDAQRDFNGTSSSTQQNKLSGSLTVIVQEVLPNGLLRVSGEKTLYLNQGEEFLRLRGYVRAGDIDTDNRVSSQRIANARIAYSGEGALADSNNPGWLTRFFSSPWMPF